MTVVSFVVVVEDVVVMDPSTVLGTIHWDPKHHHHMYLSIYEVETREENLNNTYIFKQFLENTWSYDSGHQQTGD